MQKVFVEYSNEVWNTLFSQGLWAKSEGLRLGLSTDQNTAQYRYYAKRSDEIFKIATAVLSNNTINSKTFEIVVDRLPVVPAPPDREFVLGGDVRHRRRQGRRRERHLLAVLGRQWRRRIRSVGSLCRQLQLHAGESHCEAAHPQEQRAERAHPSIRLGRSRPQHLTGSVAIRSQLLYSSVPTEVPRDYQTFQPHQIHWMAENLFIVTEDVVDKNNSSVADSARL